MALFDPEQQKMIVRVVYDGPASAGKTTNLQQLCNYFTTRRRSELYTPEEVEGRTTYFDWLMLEGGLVGGYGLRCQLVTVPGQRVLARRRSHILQQADVVVFVCGSSPEEVARARVGIDALRDYLAQRGASDVPFVLQANKQDVEGALSPEQVAQELGLDASVAMLGARANEGTGVRETAVLAIRAAANRVQSLLLERGIVALTGRADTADELLTALREAEGGGRVFEASELHRDEVRVESEAVSVSSSDVVATVTVTATVNEDRSGLSSRPEEATQSVDGYSVESEPESALEAAIAAVAESRAMFHRTLVPPAIEVSEPVSFPDASEGPGVPVNDFDPERTTATIPAPARATMPPWSPVEAVSEVAPPSQHVAPLPRPDVPSGFIWPAVGGREILRKISSLPGVLRSDLVARHGASDGSGKSDVIIYESEGWCLKTSSRRRFGDMDEARNALLLGARSKISLGAMLASGTVLAVQSDDTNGYWLWTITPWVTTLRTAMVRAKGAGDERALGDALAAFARAAVESMVLATRQGVVLDVHPSNFALENGRVVYLDDDVVFGGRIPTIVFALLQRVEEYEDCPEATEQYVTALEGEIRGRMTQTDAVALELETALRHALIRSPAALGARDRLVGTVARLSE